MHVEAYQLPPQYGMMYDGLSYSPYNQEIPNTLPYDLIRLHQEKNVLSMGLADCVTYLKALREKRVKNACQLDNKTALPPRKRKKLQQIKRHLDSEIRDRERNEQGFFNNLQACETNIILANMKAYHLANASSVQSEITSTPTLYTPTLGSYSSSDATDLTWNGWADETAVSPFQKESSNTYFMDDLAPDVCNESLRCDSAMAKDVRRPPPLSRDVVELPNSLPVPPNTAQSQIRRSSILSPEAAVFQPPNCSHVVRQDGCCMPEYQQRSMSSATAVTKAEELLQKRRCTAAEIYPVLQRISNAVQPSLQHLPGQMWCNSTPQTKPQKDAAVQMNRQRTNSL
ncbi:hypothetical protein C7974DRAFT_72398 [Boeremia exigua]|uniref:uncharacterized protein n=1 Tax=Boeremia exigua TaxID=749465 RepID=UPI001E8E159F|nr:uncharacterized protein C7974DRAFT_72398 [Boeremia exigua]KAH6614185.1 hypothetical protein C7974DRAFT_72398 [Boeremia exigua]